MMSPPACDSALPLETTVSSPFSRLQLLVGNTSDFGMCQPVMVLPSHSSFQPSAFSCADSVFGAALDFWQQVEHEVTRPVRRTNAAVMANAGGKLSLNFMRSEERRVGKECRSRWS